MSGALAGVTAALADRYRIDVGPDGQPLLLGQGGMAAVYLAFDQRHHRKVAVKVLRPELAAVVGAERVSARDPGVTANLQHPHILGLIDSGVVTVEVDDPLSAGHTGESVGLSAAPAGRVGAHATSRLTLPYYVMPYVEGESLRAEAQARQSSCRSRRALGILPKPWPARSTTRTARA